MLCSLDIKTKRESNGKKNVRWLYLTRGMSQQRFYLFFGKYGGAKDRTTTLTYKRRSGSVYQVRINSITGDHS